MKKRTLTYLGMVLLGVMTGAQLFAQTVVNMPYNTGVFSTFAIAPPGTCSFTFRDNGGTANYSNSSNPTLSVVTFAPSNSATHTIRATFSAFATENLFDALYIYHGTVAETPNLTNAGVNTVLPNQQNSGLAQNFTFRAGGFQGGTTPGTVTSNAASGALTFQFDSDFSVVAAGWEAAVAQVPVGGTACVLTPPANITTSTGAANCSADVVTPSPVFNPAGCSAPFQLQYIVDGGTPVIVPQPVAATITLLGIPKGIHTVLWRIIDPCGNVVVSQGTQTITVLDLVPPVITCPADIQVTLGPGECEAFVNYPLPTVTDNCPFFVPVVLTQNPPSLNPAQPMAAGQSLNCGFNQTKFGRVFGGPTATETKINGLQVGISNDQGTGGPGLYTFAIYRLTSGTAPAAGNANLQLLGGPFNVNMPNVIQQYVTVNFPTQITVPAASRFFVEIIDQDGNFTMGNIAAPDLPGTPSYIASAACGLANYQTFASLGFANLSLAFNVLAAVQGPPPPPVIPRGLELLSEENLRAMAVVENAAFEAEKYKENVTKQRDL
ncbi:MAG: hypothetical protein AAB316_08320, partial [Bacteroidota bacterium]